MFRLMLNAHPGLSNPGEVDFLFDYLERRPDGGWAYDKDRLIIDRIFRSYDLTILPDRDGLVLLHDLIEQLGSRAAGVPSLNIHRNIDRVFEVLPEAKFIHILRDPRDVARSSIGMGWAGTLYHGVGHWIGTEASWSKVAKVLPKDHVLELKYEDLFLDIEANLQRVCSFLGVKYEPEMLSYHENTTYAPPDSNLVEQWRRKSSPREITQVEARARALMEPLGYEPASKSDHISIPERIALAAKNKLFVWRFGSRRFGLGLFVWEKLTRRVGLVSSHRRAVLRMSEISREHLK